MNINENIKTRIKISSVNLANLKGERLVAERTFILISSY